MSSYLPMAWGDSGSTVPSPAALEVTRGRAVRAAARLASCTQAGAMELNPCAGPWLVVC